MQVPPRKQVEYQPATATMTPKPTPRKPSPKAKKQSQAGIVFALLVCIALVALSILIFPKEPIRRAQHTSGTADGNVALGSGAPTDLYDGLRISEIMASNRSAVPDESGEYGDWVEIWNSSDKDINLSGVGLSDRQDSIRFLFPDMTLRPDGRVIVFCTDTNQVEAGKSFHAKFKISSVGETISLFDPNAYLLDSVTTPILASDESYALMDGEFVAVPYYSPGFENSQAGHDAYLQSTMVVAGDLIINEVMADPLSGLADEDGEFVDWVELHNTTDHAIDLTNYALSDKENKPLKWRFPSNAVIPAGGYYVVFCSGKDKLEANTGIPHTNFRISAERDSVVLSDGHGRLVDRVNIDNLPEDTSLGRNADGVFVEFSLATPGLPNTQAGANQMDYNMRLMNHTGVIISEVMASNDSVNVGSATTHVDWVEVYNTSQTTVDLSGYGLSDNIGRPRKWQFPAGTLIYPGEYKIIYCDGLNVADNSGLHASFKILRAGGETICLSDATGRVLDKLVLPLVPTNVSYGRTIGMAGFFYYDAPTPMSANNSGFSGYAEAPAFSMEPGLHYSTVHLTLSVPKDTTVYYTMDGSIPTRSSTIYQGETLELNFTTVIRARAYSEAGLQPSTITTGTYLINAYHTLPVVSVVADPYDLFNPDNGMLTAGPNVDKSKGIPFKNTIYREVKESGIRKVGHVEYYLQDGTQMLSQGM